MKIVVLERHSVGPDVPVQYEHLGEVTCYRNTTTPRKSESGSGTQTSS